MASTVVAAWPSVTLGEVMRKSEEWVDVDPEREYAQVTVRLWGKGVALRGRTSGAQIAASRQLVVHPGQFILSRIDARNGAFGLVPPELDGALVSNDFPAFDLDTSRVLPAFLAWMSKTHDFVDLCQRASEGTTNRVRLKEERFLAAEIPLPPLDEQQRIVARIEALAARIEEARRLRRETKAETEALQDSAVAECFAQPALYEAGTSALGEVGDIRSGVTLGRVLTGSTVRVPYLRVANVQDGHLDLRTVKEIDILPDELDKWRLEPGDVLLTEGGDWDKLGRGTVWEGEIADCIHQNHIFRVRVNTDLFEPRFVAEFIGSRNGKQYFQAAAKQTTNLATINQRQLRAFRIPCPPAIEQRRVLRHLDEVRVSTRALQQMQAEVEAELGALLPSVLDRAFRGEL